jgi:hypothetical protein
LRRLALLCAAFALAALAVVVISRAPTAQTTSPQACRSDSGPISATALPETVELEECPIGGRVITDSGVQAVLPAAGQGVYVEALTTEGAQELEVTRYRDGTVELEHVGDEVEEARASLSVVTDARRRRSDECRDSAFANNGWRVTAGFGYNFNRSTTPSEVSAAAAAGAIKAGGTNITSTKNNCRLPDGVTAELRYLRDTNATADIDTDGCTTTSDRLNVVSFGDLVGGTLAIACTRFGFNPSGYDEVTEADIKVNKADFNWTVNPGSRSCRNSYDLQSVMTHERGHNFGLGHVSQTRHASLTMSPLIGSCQLSDRTLGRGDVLGLNRKYL